ncbi:hypothetical protein FIV00_15130 [Labrenzia sp. THAF82]|uniref:hypothetical protein n=1 Tax=Labrenzia sp. THAF82 TaxID=2587861 RepID=UPI001268C88E|nr:hypothetical protein [Labrenzia sp. THAF82]QFT31824.1 hypothetical protein FIV00_15130 [Labrenzia sp. THAF82]
MSGVDSGDVWLIGIALTAVAAVGGVLARDRAQARQQRDAENKLHDRISRVKEEVLQEVKVLRADFTDYKLSVAREYASVDHLKEVESRLVDAIEKLTAKLETMPTRLAAEIKQSLGNGP